jgi:hypothetical protein
VKVSWSFNPQNLVSACEHIFANCKRFPSFPSRCHFGWTLPAEPVILYVTDAHISRACTPSPKEKASRARVGSLSRLSQAPVHANVFSAECKCQTWPHQSEW